MTLEATLSAARNRAEMFMTDTGVMRRATGNFTTDPDTGSELPEYADVFTSKAKIQARNLQARQEEVGGRTATTVSVELHLPVGVPPVQAGDIWEHTAVGALSDVQLLGRRFRVVAPVAKSFATARRLDVEEIVS